MVTNTGDNNLKTTIGARHVTPELKTVESKLFSNFCSREHSRNDFMIEFHFVEKLWILLPNSALVC